MALVQPLFLTPVQFFDPSTNEPLSGGQIFIYGAGGVTKLPLYSDSAGTITLTNPVICDSVGRPTTDGTTLCEIWLGLVPFKIVLARSTDTDPPASPLITLDNLKGEQITSNLYDSDGNLVLAAIVSSGTEVNYFTMAGSATTAAPVLTVAGSDTNIDLSIKAKNAADIITTSETVILKDVQGDTGFIITPDNTAPVIENPNANTNTLYKTTGTGIHVFSYQDTRTNTIVTPVSVRATTSGTPAANIGTGILFEAESADENPSNAGQVGFAFSDVSAGSEDSYFRVSTRVAGAALATAYTWTVTNTGNYIYTGAPTAARTITLPDCNVPRYFIKEVYTPITAVASGTTTIPKDNTMPQITEGTEFGTVVITPENAANILVLEIGLMGACSVTGVTPIIALFQDATANALKATVLANGTTSADFSGILLHRMVAGTASATTFRVRAGPSSAATIYINGDSGGTQIFGGVGASFIRVVEYSP